MVEQRNDDEVCINENITAKQVRLIDANNENRGIVSIREALAIAEEEGLDLIEISPQATPPVCKILDFGKYRYEQQKKAKENRKNQVRIEVKEIQLTPQTGLHDMETKARAATKFLAAGNKIKVGVRYRGRQMTHLEVGEETLNKFIELLGDAAAIEKPAAMEGRWLIAVLAPKRK
jgi:translation initiation factor IF-3